MRDSPVTVGVITIKRTLAKKPSRKKTPRVLSENLVLLISMSRCVNCDDLGLIMKWVKITIGNNKQPTFTYYIPPCVVETTKTMHQLDLVYK